MALGGAIKLHGESEYRRALSQITQNLREVSSEMKVVTSAYDKNDTSTEALAANSDVLSKRLEQQKEKVNLVADQYKKYEEAVKKSANEHEQLGTELESAKAELERIGNATGETSAEYEKQKKVVDQLQSEYDESTKAQDANAKSLSNLKIQLNSAQADVNKTSKELENLGNASEDSGKKADEAASGGFTVMKGVLSNLATDAIHAALDGLKQLGSAIIDTGKQSLEAYSNYEQLVGGVETLFGAGGKSLEEYAQSVGISVDEAKGQYDKLMGAQSAVLENANNAYKTAGLSANEYMDTVTSFSASLIQSLGGDTAQAAQYANTAITDMSDNANKMGTDMSSLQNAYAGFAKGNYTMLDNLKLGYGGTKEEMQRLLNDAEKLPGAMGRKFDLSNYADVVEAIHLVQDNMGITGTTAKEASTTIEGSANAMKAAWQNLLTGMADDNANFGELVGNLVDSVTTFGKNVIPRVQQIIKGMAQVATQMLQEVVPQIVKEIPPLLSETLPMLIDALTAVVQSVIQVLPTLMPIIVDAIMQIVHGIIALLPEFLNAGIQMLTSLIHGITNALPQLIAMLPTIVSNIETTLNYNLPIIINTGTQVLFALINGIVNALPQLIAMLPTIVSTISETLHSNLPMVINTGTQVLVALINGIVSVLPQLIDMLPTIVSTIVTTLHSNLPMIINAGIQILVALINGIVSALPQLIAYTPRLITTFVQVMTQNLPQILSMGGQIISSLINGIASMIGNLGGTIGNVASTIINGIGSLPSQLYNWGVDMVRGIANGIRNAIGYVTSAVSSVANKIKSFLHFSRPDEGPLAEYESWMPDMVEGLSDSLRKASPELISQTEALANGMSDAFNVNGSVSASGGRSYDSMVEAFKEALSQVKIEMDDEEMGHFVDKTVTKLIYN